MRVFVRARAGFAKADEQHHLGIEVHLDGLALESESPPLLGELGVTGSDAREPKPLLVRDRRLIRHDRSVDPVWRI